MDQKRNINIDFWKGIACLGVILIHCPFPGKFGVLLRTTSKFAVPFFFAVSGYYFSGKMQRKIKHILGIVIFGELFYFGYDVVVNWINGANVFQFASEQNTLITLGRLILFNAPLTRPHLWFLYALIYCYLFAYIIRQLPPWIKICLTVFGLAGFTVFSELATFVGLLNRFCITINGNEISSFSYNLFVFRALPFFLFGELIKVGKNKCVKIPGRMLLIMMSVGVILSIVERLILTESQFYVGTYLFTFGIFVLVVKYPYGIKRGYAKLIEIINEKVIYIGKYLSMYIYILHIFCYEICGMVVSEIGIGGGTCTE